MLCFPNFRTQYILIKRCVVSYCRQKKNTLGIASGGAKLLTCTRPPDYYQANTQIYRPIHNNTYSIKCIFDKVQCHHIQVPSNVLAKVNSFKVTYIWTCPASEALSCRPNTLYKSLQHYVMIHPIIYNKKDSLHILHHSKYYYTQEILKICTWYYSTYTYYLQATTISQITLLEYQMLKKNSALFLFVRKYHKSKLCLLAGFFRVFWYCHEKRWLQLVT